MTTKLEEPWRKAPYSRKPNKSGIESHDGREEALLDFILNHPNFDQFEGSPIRLLSAIDEFSYTKNFLISIGDHKGQILSDLLKKERPKVIIELGGYLGYSAILFAHTLLSTKERFHIWSLEAEPEFASIAKKLIDIVGLSDHISVVVGKAKETLKELHDKDEVTKVDLLFLDHVEDLYVSDFEVCKSLALFKEGTLIVADNVVRPGAPEYREFVRSDPGLSSVGVRGLIQPGDFEDELEITHVISSDSRRENPTP